MKKLVILSLLGVTSLFAQTNLNVTLTPEQWAIIEANTPTNQTPQQYFTNRVAQEIREADHRRCEREDSQFLLKFKKATTSKRQQVIELLNQP